MIKNIKTLFTDPGMIEVEFEPLDQTIIDEIYTPENFKQMSFENLGIEVGRKTLTDNALGTNCCNKIVKHFTPMYKEVTKVLTEIDKIRFPIFIDFDDWWLKNNFDNKAGYSLVEDKAGFSQPWHLDNRFSMWAGSINLADNDTKTAFSKTNHDWTDNGKDPNRKFYEASNKKWVGTFWLNTENNWHAVPLVQQDRRAIICNLLLAD
jgi:hypothetical protein